MFKYRITCNTWIWNAVFRREIGVQFIRSRNSQMDSFFMRLKIRAFMQGSYANYCGGAVDEISFRI